jgi:hypothetical protein
MLLSALIHLLRRLGGARGQAAQRPLYAVPIGIESTQVEGPLTVCRAPETAQNLLAER